MHKSLADLNNSIVSRGAEMGELKRFSSSDDKNKKLYHNTKLLLKLYPKVIWRINNEVLCIQEEVSEYGVKAINEYIDLFDEQITQSKIEENLQDLTYSNCIIRILDKSIDILKKYPEVGELYYSILRYSYLEKEKYKENYILEHLAISRSTYFRVKKEAINLLSTIIWGYEIPKVINMFEDNKQI